LGDWDINVDRITRNKLAVSTHNSISIYTWLRNKDHGQVVSFYATWSFIHV